MQKSITGTDVVGCLYIAVNIVEGIGSHTLLLLSATDNNLIHTGSAAIVGMLLDAKADLNITSTEGMMPIHKASSEGHYEAVKKLIDKGALVNFCTSTGSTPLHYAASTGKIDVLKLLIDSGCPVNAMSTGNLSCTALYCAASSGQLEAVDMLLQHGAEVDTICTNDCTALHVAASNGHAQVGQVHYLWTTLPTSSDSICRLVTAQAQIVCYFERAEEYACHGLNLQDDV